MADAMLRTSLTRTLDGTPLPSLMASVGSSRSPPPSYRSKRSAVYFAPEASSRTKENSEKSRKHQLQQEIDRANARLPPKDTKGLFRAACSTDLLFLVDATNSMGPYIEAAKEQVKAIVADVKKAFLDEAEVRVAVVSYKDYGVTPNIEFLDFTSSADQVREFLDCLCLDWGRDWPEDVLGGLQQAVNASWKHQTRCIVHIGDSPPHGRTLHDGQESDDRYYHTESEPCGLTHGPLLRKLIRLNINYALLRITTHTDRMGLVFARSYGRGNAKLHANNKYHGILDASFESMTNSQRSSGAATAPQFEELQLGITYSQLRHLVVKTVTSSASRTAGRLSMAVSRAIRSVNPSTIEDLAAIHEEDDHVGRRNDSSEGSVTLENLPPQWTTPGWLDLRLQVDGFCPAIVVHNANTLSDMMADDKNIKLNVTRLTLYARSKPFAEGSVRVAAYAGTAASSGRYVMKSFKKHGKGLAEAAEDMRIQALCKAFALEFNGLLKVDPPLDFIVTSCLQHAPNTAGSRNAAYLSLEPFIEGDYVKYNTNSAYVNEELGDDPFNQMAQAFSHFTFERSWGHFLVTDLQGSGHLLTDPAIQTKDPERFKLNDTNLNEEGFKFFFATHKCNDVCRKLSLQSNAEMLISGKMDFREQWPVMDPTVCCSNNLCRSIIRLSEAQESDKFLGHHWCNSCWPQLASSTNSRICVELGPHHEFEVSEFFLESQGQLVPNKCPEHSEKDTTESSAAAVGGMIFSRLRSAPSMTAINGRSY
ncbi:hypothetical protein BAUCODRAFT_146198 [Baudoinia panamericana UAMH 10762]|uniref:Alpha-type protein kinase domain-containing protein n=1 Tax=Baudoinia panamericana (strain UAMH 10762) TaxID=717646 RepID=M2LX14_BAUPA|nr:uncharacterized protein BAUCODRAFT_146198 [Baudoinia panamericana UAMH 10762]EMC99227.1 hypothetical protein BAUCODRAFT_146198 [Baudoinia panamericana UAMH 10762]